MRIVRVCALLVLVALATLPSATAETSPRAVRSGGINVTVAVRPWRYRGPNPDGWWCRPGACRSVRNGTAYVDREVPLLANLGVRVVRVDFPWTLIQPVRGRFDWDRADYIVRKLRRRGLPIHALLAYTPPWAGATEATPPRASDFAAFARAFARRFRRSIRYVELWNEPDLERYWAGSPEQYVGSVLVPGYRAIKSVAPRTRVLIGAPSYANVSWYERVYATGGGRSFDLAGFHDYSADRRILENARTIRRVLRAHGQARKPIWLGEYGFEEPDAGANDVGHAALLTQILTERGPIAVAEWYTLRDDFVMGCCPPRVLENSTYGLVTAEYRLKRSYAAMRRLLRR